jgi:hypothetical protein
VRNDDGDRINVNLSDVPKNITTFHSPDTNFRTPFLSVVELKLYGYLRGNSRQQFIEPDQHPKNKLIANLSIWMMIVGGIIEGIIANLGKRTINQPGAGHTRKFGPDISGGAIPSGTVNTFAGGNGTINTSISTDEYEYTDNGSETTDDFTQNNGPLDTFNTDWADYFNNGGAIAESFFNGTQLGQNYQDFNDVGGFYRGGIYTAPNYNTELSGWQYFQGNDTINFLLNIPLDITKFAYYFSEGADITLRIIYAFVPERQYALQMISHGFYSKFENTSCATPQRFKIEDSLYLNDTIQELKPYDLGTVRYRVNNLKRSNTIVIRTVNGNDVNDGPYFISGPTADNSLVTIGTVSANSNMYEDKNKTLPFKRKIASHYAGLKYRIVNQYGQLESIKQIPITACETKFDPDTLPVQGPVCSNPFVFQKVAPPTGPLFNGDTYINRYTEKNSMFFFYDWLYGQPNSYEYNYFIRQMIPEPRFMMNSERYESTNLSAQNFAAMLAALGSGTVANGTGLLPNAYYRLDNKNYKYNNDETPSLGGALGGFAYPLVDGYPGVFGVKESYFYLATSAVRDFFVESDVIVDFRETGVEPFQLHYDPYRFTDLTELFNINPDIITRGNYYSYDYSLSISKLFTQYFSQGNLQSRYYDPEIAKLCYTYYPDRIIYSLPQQEESAKDSWFVYLANNYKEFKDQISGVKNFAKTGIFITFKNSSPLTFQGVDQLQTEFGVKVTIGDGGLFAQTPQAVSVSDKPYEYGSSQSRRSVISTPAGLYYISQNQGKVMLYGGGLEEISQNGLKWWFNEFLPYRLLEDFPDYPHTDNPVAAIGCQAIYDNKNTILYFTKKDYKVRDEIKDFISYDADKNDFYVNNGYKSRIRLGDPIFFEDASWTISYDPKSKFWISYHDWHPSLLMPAKGTFLSTYTDPNTGQAGIWKHGDACNSYCNYYGVDYPFEVEFPFITGQTVTTTRSMEYMLECYRRSEYNCIDQYHVLDHNFDRAVVFNSEQTSGYLNLNIFPKNNVTLSLEYPKLLTSIPIEPAIVPPISMPAFDILFSKEENKYRFNQFWDITKDRGEFPTGSDYPPTGPLIPGTTVLQGPYTNQNIWITKANGYIKTLNPANLDYDKPKLQRKKFRHYLNFLNLTKQVSGDTNMIIKIVNVKNIYSPR